MQLAVDFQVSQLSKPQIDIWTAMRRVEYNMKYENTHWIELVVPSRRKQRCNKEITSKIETRIGKESIRLCSGKMESLLKKSEVERELKKW